MERHLRMFIIAFALGCSSDAEPDRPIVVGFDVGADVGAADTAAQDDAPALPPGVLVVEPTRLLLNESGGTGTFSVALGVRPSADVIVTIEVSDATEVRTGGPLTFSPENWSTPQTVTITGVDDACFDGTQTVELVLAAAGQGNYEDVLPVTVSVDTLDDDSPSTSVTPTAVTVSEDGRTGSFAVVLSAGPCEESGMPWGPVRIPVSVSDPLQIAVDAEELVFTEDNFSTPQSVVVSAVPDQVDEFEQSHAVIVGTAIGGGYDGFDPPDVHVTVTSDITPAIEVAPTSLTTSESGTSATFDISLNAPGTEPVGIRISAPPDEGMVAPFDITFAPGETGPQTITVTGVADNACDGAQIYALDFIVTAADDGFDGLEVPQVAVTNTDIDGASVSVGPTSLAILEGDTDGFEVALSCDPGEPVTIDFVPSAPAELSVSPASLTFDSTNFMTLQRVNVVVDDNLAVDGNRSVAIATTLTATLGYQNVDPADVDVLVIDDD